MMNLLSNAIKFSLENTLIEIKTAVQDSKIILSVIDSGIGISQEDQKHLFERFFRAGNADNIQGTGLGLHIVGRYVDLMNGKIECISGPNHGTEFKITFNNQ